MKILVVSPYFFPKIGGLENYCYNISKLLVEKGHELYVLTSGTENSEENIDGINIIRIKPSLTISNTPINFGLIFKISKIIKDKEIDIVNAQTPVPFYADMAAIASKIKKVPFILTYHNDLTKPGSFLKILSNLYNHTLLKSTLSNSARIITSSPYVFNESKLIESYKQKVVLIPPGVDLKKYSPGKSSSIYKRFNIPLKSKIILFVGAMNKGHAHKGVDVLLKSFKRVLEYQDDAYLVLAGSGNMIEEYRKLSKDLEILKNTVFTGFIDEKTLINLYKNSYMLILPTISIAEGFGMVLIEANACGRPVIGSNIGGIKYVIRDGENGLLVPPKDVEKLAGSIIKLLSNENLANKMSEMGRKMVEIDYTWEKSSIITEKLYKDILNY